MSKRFLCLLLAAAMLFTMLGLCSCANESTQEDGQETTKSQNQPKEDEGNNDDYTDDLPDNLTFNKSEIKILAKDKAGVTDELYSEKGQTGALINDTVYERNLNVEERLQVKMKVDLVDMPNEVLPTEVASGSGHDMISDATYMAIQQVLKGHYRNLNESDYIDTSKLYWSQGYNDIASYDGKQFLATGSMALSLFRYMFITIYNKVLFEAKGQQDLFDVVKNYEWTLEYQQSIIQDTYVDNNSNSKMDTDDFYGFITGDTVSVDPYCVASGIELIAKNADGDWFYDQTCLETMDRLGEAISLIYNNSNGTYVFKTATYDDTGKTDIVEMFANKNGMMATVQLFALETNSGSIDFDYGVAPIPKLSRDQKYYASYVQDQVTSYGISIITTNDRMPMISAFMEAMASESYKTVVDAYYNTALYRYVKNPEAKEMLDMIYNSIKFDFSGSFSNLITGCIVRDQLRPILSGSSKKGISSTMKNWDSRVNKKLATVNESLAALKD